MYFIKQITSQDTFAVRQPVLRPGKPASSCIFEGDDLPSTVHFGIFDAAGIAGIVSVFKIQSDLFTQNNQFQLRGMAVLEQHQRKGLGEKLVAEAEKYITEHNGDLIWFNARETAVGFYEKLGYTIIGGAFTIPDVGPHYVMHKNF